jgi:uncharacterized protein
MKGKNLLRKARSDGTAHYLTVIPQIQVTLNCNLDCSYCFQKHRGGIIDISTVEAILQKTVSNNRNKRLDFQNNVIQVYWHGGEPLLAGVEFFQKIMEIESRFPGAAFENRMQTNGTLMTEEFAGFLAENNFAVGFSLDGPEGIHNRNRRFRNSNNGSFGAAMQGIELYRRYAKPDRIAVIAVITRASLDRVSDIYEFFKELGAQVQLDIYDIRCLDLHNSIQDHADVFELAPSPDEVGRFLIDLFDLWFYDQTRRVDFNELRNEVKMILQPEIKRGDPFHKKRCDFRRTIFDPNGRAFSCDQYVNDDKTALGDIQKDSMENILEKKARLWEEIKKHIRKSGDKMACASCEWGSQCNGGCITCMKYNALLLSARAQGLPDHRWFEAELASPLREVSGETYYCDGLRAFRHYVKEAVKQELSYG